MEKDTIQAKLYEHDLSYFLLEDMLDFFELVWMEIAEQSVLEPFKKLAITFKGHLFGIKTFFEQGHVTNGVLESLNSKVQLAKRRARRYSNVDYFMDMVYYINGGDCFHYPHEST